VDKQFNDAFMHNSEIPMSVTASAAGQHAVLSNTSAKPENGRTDEPSEPRSIDEIIDDTLAQCEKLPSSYSTFKQQIQELHSRLAYGRLHLAVVGEFNRGKSTFINSLIGIKLLPTSVLPITSVTTNIVYGKDVSCTIRFLFDKPAVVVTASREAVTATLFKYVAEENNPKNQYSVRSVEVTVPAPLLENGTVLIDTPGFGSTYLHNTQTALSSLTDCDAALFLLSVDPPMTQTETEFLKMVVNHVPRIFFIINKIDLLSGSDLAKVDGFVRKILMGKLPSSVQPHIFQISAMHAGKAKSQSISDTFWAQSGMEAVRNDIIGFMTREKYFTLSQALNDKLKEAINNILSSLQKELSEITEPISRITIERNEIAKEADAIKKAVEKELTVVAAEKSAIIRFFNEKLSAGRLKLIRQIHDATDGLLNASSCSGESISSISIALNQIIPEALYTFKVQLITGLNRPLKRATVLHGKDYTITLESIRACLGTGTPQESKLYEKLESLEFEPEERPETVEDASHITMVLNFSDHFLTREQKIKKLHTRYSQQLDEIIKNDLFAFSKNAKSRIDTTFTTLCDLLNEEYNLLILQLDLFTSNKERAIASHKEKSDAPAATLGSHIGAFREILAHLH
jgi:GTPase SAR1 family protein